MEKVKHLKETIAAILAILTALWGWFGWLVFAWAACMAADVATGMGVAIKAGTWSSKVARDGCWHKLGSIVAVLMSGVLDLVVGLLLDNVPGLPLHYTVLLCPLVIVWYILTEAGSIIENVGKLGSGVPPWLRKAIAALKDTVDTVGDADKPPDT